jgi:8-oxo-dGTP pyrophosphatase MutT (NUDIX family)
LLLPEKIFRIVSVVFKKQNNETIFLLLHRCLHWNGWELVKGQLEGNESPEEAAQREVFEETGLKNIRIVKKIDHAMRFFDRVQKKESEAFGFLVESLDEKAVSLEQNPVKEHDSFEWVDSDTVLKKLRFENMRELFSAALVELKSLPK